MLVYIHIMRYCEKWELQPNNIMPALIQRMPKNNKHQENLPAKRYSSVYYLFVG